ncbi:MAG: HlyD family efflux transporter periplasmic adaptor subunit [Planctomycetes bacterium]|nr:HlyD family efflux transporter periplasmic adaptor subunit [Planctomycetota bacterium]
MIRSLLRICLSAAALAVVASAQLRVSVMKPEQVTVVRHLTVKGDVMAYQTATLRARVTGILANLPWMEGDVVSGAAEVATLKVPDLEAELKQARARTAAVAAEKDEAAAMLEEIAGDIAAARAVVLYYKAKEGVVAAQLAMKKMIAERAKGLASERAGPVARGEDAAAEVKLIEAQAVASQQETAKAEAAVKAAESRRTAGSAHVKSVAAKHDASSAAESVVSTRIAFAHLASPFTKAVVSKRHVDPGALIEADSTPIVTLLDATKVRIRFSLTERDAWLLKIGDVVSMRLQTDPHVARTVKVARVAGALDAWRNRWFEIELSNNGDYLPGSFAYFDLTFRSAAGKLAVPTKYVIMGRGQPRVLVAEGNKVVAREIVLGVTGVREADVGKAKRDERVEIVSGLAPDDRVIKSNVAGLRVGEAITPILEKAK